MCAPGRNRTCDLGIRRPSLYPTELRRRREEFIQRRPDARPADIPTAPHRGPADYPVAPQAGPPTIPPARQMSGLALFPDVETRRGDQVVDAAGLPERLSAFDMLLHRGEANPRTRSGIMALEILDTTPDWDRFLAVFENASRRVLRLRQKVVSADRPDGLASLGGGSGFQPQLPRPARARPGARDAKTGNRPRRGEFAVAAGHLETPVDGHPGRRPRGRQSCDRCCT